MEELKLNKEQIDVLREISSVGSGSAATALSQLLRTKVSISVPQVSLMSSDRISVESFFLAPDEVGLAVDLKIVGSLKGGIVVLFAQKSALLMIDILAKRPIGSTQLLNLLEASALAESSHILSGAYLNAMGEMLQLHQLMLSIPQTIVDRMDRLQKLLIRRFADEGVTYLLPIENKLLIEDIEVDVFVVCLLEYDSVKEMLKVAGV
jgi:chemotaxis protein CheC